MRQSATERFGHVEGAARESCLQECSHYAELWTERNDLLTAMNTIARLSGAAEKDGSWSILGTVESVRRMAQPSK